MENEIQKEQFFKKQLKALNDFLENTPKDEIKKIHDEVKEMNLKGPTVEEYFNYLAQYYNDPSLRMVNDDENVKIRLIEPLTKEWWSAVERMELAKIFMNKIKIK